MNFIKTNEIDGLWSYLKSIDWSEPWLTGLISFHGVCFFLTYLLHTRMNVQAVYFVILLVLVYLAENINEYAAKYWRLFASQQYFDSNGLFISVVFSGPLLLNCLIIIIYWMYYSGNLLIKVKRAEAAESSWSASHPAVRLRASNDTVPEKKCN